MNVEIKITKEMLLAAVATTAAQDNLTALVAETIGKQMAEYFTRDHYGNTEFQRTVQSFIKQVAIAVLEGKRGEIEAYVGQRVDDLLANVKQAAADRIMSRIEAAIT